MGRKQDKAEQRKKYKDTNKKYKPGHGGLAIKKRDIAALGR
jgi:hypothetical protein